MEIVTGYVEHIVFRNEENGYTVFQLETYCPARMTIADTDAYGDSEYQASNGNIMSSARYA